MVTFSSTAPRSRLSPQHDRLVLALASLSSFVVILDATIVSVALPSIGAELGFAASTLPWVVNAYTLLFAGFLLLGGRCADAFGQRAVLLAGLALFTAASLGGGLAWSPAVLLAARAAQGLGGALLIPAALALLTATFEEGPRRAHALSTWSAVGAIGAASGPVAGGLLTQAVGWRWVLFVNVPVGLVGLAGAALVLTSAPLTRARPSLDVVGAVLATAGLLGVVYALMESEAGGWHDPTVPAGLVGGVLLLALFLVHQARWSADPLLPLSLFRSPAVRGANLVMFLLGLGFFACPVLISFVLQYVHGSGPLAAGLGFLPTGLAMFAGARLAGPLTVRFGPRRAAVFGCGLGAFGLAAMAVLIDTGSSYLWSVALPGVVFGFGTAAAFTPLTVSATSEVGGERGGVAAAVLNTVRQTSGAVGLALITSVSGALAAGWARAHPGAVADGPAALAHGYSGAFLLSACCVAGAAGLAAVAMPRPNRPFTRSAGGGGASSRHTGALPGQVALLLLDPGGREVVRVSAAKGAARPPVGRQVAVAVPGLARATPLAALERTRVDGTERTGLTASGAPPLSAVRLSDDQPTGGPFAGLLFDRVARSLNTSGCERFAHGHHLQELIPLLREHIDFRTRYVDDRVRWATDLLGMNQVVIVAAGLDTRAVRLLLPPRCVVYELDLPQVLEFKDAVLAGREPLRGARRVPVAVDLREDFSEALLRQGFCTRMPSCWLIEGLLMYLPPTDADRLLRTVTGLAAPDSVLVLDHAYPEVFHHPDFAAGVRVLADNGFGLCSVVGGPEDWLAGYGWAAEVADPADLATQFARPVPAVLDPCLPHSPAFWYASATRTAR